MKATKLPKDPSAGLPIVLRVCKPGKVVVFQVCHDDGCPAIASQRDADCKPPCSPDVWLVEPFANERAN